MLKVEAAIQRDLGGLKKWLLGTSWSSGEANIVYLWWNSPVQRYWLGTDWKAALPKGTLGSWGTTAVPESVVCPCSKEGQPYIGLSRQKRSQQVRRSDSSPVLGTWEMKDWFWYVNVFHRYSSQILEQVAQRSCGLYPCRYSKLDWTRHWSSKTCFKQRFGPHQRSLPTCMILWLCNAVIFDTQ